MAYKTIAGAIGLILMQTSGALALTPTTGEVLLSESLNNGTSLKSAPHWMEFVADKGTDTLSGACMIWLNQAELNSTYSWSDCGGMVVKFSGEEKFLSDHLLKNGETYFFPITLDAAGNPILPIKATPRLVADEIASLRNELSSLSNTFAADSIAFAKDVGGRISAIESFMGDLPANVASVGDVDMVFTAVNDLSEWLTLGNFDGQPQFTAAIEALIATSYDALNGRVTANEESITSLETWKAEVATPALGQVTAWQAEVGEQSLAEFVAKVTPQGVTEARVLELLGEKLPGAIDTRLSELGLTIENGQVVLPVPAAFDLPAGIASMGATVVDGKLVFPTGLTMTDVTAALEAEGGLVAELRSEITTVTETATSKSWVGTVLGVILVLLALVLAVLTWFARKPGVKALTEATSATTLASSAKTTADEVRATIAGDGTDANPGLTKMVAAQTVRLDDVEAHLRFNFAGVEEFVAALKAAHFDTPVDGTIVLDAGTPAEQRFAVQAQKPRKDVVTFIFGVKDLTTEIPLSSVVSAIKKAAKQQRLDKSLPISAAA